MVTARRLALLAAITAALLLATVAWLTYTVKEL